ncbi:hypothetical protein JXL19_06315 [bacterium]|nr:hypothetical protein [bacterium]
MSCSKLTRRHIGLGLELEKEGYPLRVLFQGIFFKTGDKTERWQCWRDPDPLQENLLDMHGSRLDVLAYYEPYSYAPKDSFYSIRPFVGGGLIYRRYKFDRRYVKGEMIGFNNNDDGFYFGNQDILAIGAMPHIGFIFDMPKRTMDIRMNFGWAFFASNSNIDYIVSFIKNETIVYPMEIYNSGYSILCGMNILKKWETFSVSLGYEWEKTVIDDKNIFFYSTKTTPIYLPFPKFDIRQSIGKISINYPF